MNIFNILPFELTQMIYKHYFDNVLEQIKIKRCFTTLYLDAKCTKTTKCSCMIHDSAFCKCCQLGTIEYY
jgi:hypothetical protein